MKNNELGMYLYYDDRHKLTMTDKVFRAEKFESEEKAYRVLNCSFPKNRRKGWKTEEYQLVSKPGRVRVTMEQAIQPPVPWDEVCDELEKVYSKLIIYKEELTQQLIKVEAELCDCDHACEFFRCDASKGYKLYKMIHERRVLRRQLKNELRKTKAVLEFSNEELGGGDLRKVFEEVDSQSYVPRVLTELFS